jgi:hypothetical protein
MMEKKNEKGTSHLALEIGKKKKKVFVSTSPRRIAIT